MDKMIKEIDYIYTLQEITDIVDKLFSPDDYILDESGRYILGIRNTEESRKRNYITELLLKLRDINKKIKNGDFNIGYRYTYEEIQNMKDDRQKIYNTLCKELNISVKEGKMIKEIGLLREYDQIIIRNDIEKRIIPQALVILKHNPCGFENYIENEIKSAERAKIKMIEASYLPGAIHYNISKIYVYNDERLKALNELRKSVKANIKNRAVK